MYTFLGNNTTVNDLGQTQTWPSSTYQQLMKQQSTAEYERAEQAQMSRRAAERVAYESRNNLLPGVSETAGFRFLAKQTDVENQAAKLATVSVTGNIYEDYIAAQTAQAANLNRLIPTLQSLQGQTAVSQAVKAESETPWGLIIGFAGVALIGALMIFRR